MTSPGPECTLGNSKNDKCDLPAIDAESRPPPGKVTRRWRFAIRPGADIIGEQKIVVLF
jgi:hypothetical protein